MKGSRASRPTSFTGPITDANTWLNKQFCHSSHADASGYTKSSPDTGSAAICVGYERPTSRTSVCKGQAVFQAQQSANNQEEFVWKNDEVTCVAFAEASKGRHTKDDSKKIIVTATSIHA